MTWTPPTDPVPSTVITAAYAVANFINQILHLRAMTGNADPPASNRVVVSSSTAATEWGQVPTDAIADRAITNAKIALATITNDLIQDGQIPTAKLTDLNVTAAKLAADSVTTSKILDANVTAAKLATGAVTNAKIADANITAEKIQDGQVTTAKLADANVTTAKIADSNITTAKIADTNVTAAKLASGAAASNIGTAGVTASMLASGAALSNLGYTPSRIASGTYTGNGGTSARQITTGFVVKLVLIHDSANDTMYVAINTTNSIRLGPSPNFVQGSASVHVHGSDGFVVADGTVQGNVNTNTYSYTAFG